MNKTTLIVLGIIGLITLSFFTLEFFRGKELKNNLPEYVVAASYDEAFINAESLAREVNGKYHVTDGESNSWFLPFNKSIIVLDNTPYGELQKHDFVGYVNSQGTKIFHRLIKQKDEGWVAQGDNNANVDVDLVTESNYIGRLAEPIISWQGALIKDESILSVFD